MKSDLSVLNDERDGSLIVNIPGQKGRISIRRSADTDGKPTLVINIRNMSVTSSRIGPGDTGCVVLREGSKK